MRPWSPPGWGVPPPCLSILSKRGFPQGLVPQPVSITHAPPACTHKPHLPLAGALTLLKSLPAPPPHPPPPLPFAPPASPANKPIPTCTPIPCPYPPSRPVPRSLSTPHPCLHGSHGDGRSSRSDQPGKWGKIHRLPSPLRPLSETPPSPGLGAAPSPPTQWEHPTAGTPRPTPLQPVLPWQPERGVPPLRVPVPAAPGMGVSGTAARGCHPGLPPVRRGGGR